MSAVERPKLQGESERQAFALPKEVRGASFAGVTAGSSPSFLGRERTAVDVDVGPERRRPRHHETCLALRMRERWGL